MRVLPIILLGVLGCGPTTSLLRLTPDSHGPKPADSPVLLYSARLPECPFEEVAIVSAKEENALASPTGMGSALKRKAREVGGDALVRVSFVSARVITGTVVRFTTDTCRR